MNGTFVVVAIDTIGHVQVFGPFAGAYYARQQINAFRREDRDHDMTGQNRYVVAPVQELAMTAPRN